MQFFLIYSTSQVAAVLEELSQGTQDDALMAYQIAFDLYESATQQFLNNVVQAVRKTAPIPAAVKGSTPKGKGLVQIFNSIFRGRLYYAMVIMLITICY